jgi:hypothetical protein
MLPSQCKLADLSGYDKLQGQLMLRTVFLGADKDLDRKIAVYRRILIRLMDKALVEYKLSRDALNAQVREKERAPEEMARTGRYIYLFSFSDHMENCIHTLRRMLRFTQRIMSDIDAPAIPRLLRRRIEAFGTDVVGIRNTIEHMDNKIQDDAFENGKPILLSLAGNSDRIEIGSNSLSFETLGSLIRSLHEFCTFLIHWTDKHYKQTNT